MIKYSELWPPSHPNIVNCGPEHMYILPSQCININGAIENSEQRYKELCVQLSIRHRDSKSQLSIYIIYHHNHLSSLSSSSSILSSFYAFDRIFMHMFQITFHLFWDDFSLLSILLLLSFHTPHACLLLTHTHNNVIFNPSLT